VLIEWKAVEDVGFERKVKHVGKILSQLINNALNGSFGAKAPPGALAVSYP